MLKALCDVLRETGDHLVQWRESSEANAGHWEGTQFKAKADQWSHDLLSRGLQKMDPGIPIVSEESPWPASSATHYWLIDPIDGTASYAQGFKGYVTQAALMENNRPRLAVVYAPAEGKLLAAERGGGSTLNGAPFQVLPPPRSAASNFPSAGA